MVLAISKRFHGPRLRTLRTLLYVALGLCGLLPYSHSTLLYGFTFTRQSLSFDDTWMMTITILFGAYLYVSRIPEKWFPGYFDLWVCYSFILILDEFSSAFSHDGDCSCSFSVQGCRSIHSLLASL
jgi:adiponectin receptor